MKKIRIIYTGGTIGMVRNIETNSLEPFDFEHVKSNIPELNRLNAELSYTSFDPVIDSSDCSPKEWIQLVEIIEKEYETHDGFVVLHGTDTMAYTGSALSFMIQNPQKPIILTGSQLPIGDLRTDAKENLITAIEFATKEGEDKTPLIQEVALYFEYKLYRANRAKKISSQHFNAFETPNLDELAESGVYLEINKEILFRSKKPTTFIKKINKKVSTLKIYPGQNFDFLSSLVDKLPYKVIILEVYGGGNAPLSIDFQQFIKKCQFNSIFVVVCSQCMYGDVVLGDYENGRMLKEFAIGAKDMTFESALTKSMVILEENMTVEEFKTKFLTPFSGEIRV